MAQKAMKIDQSVPKMKISALCVSIVLVIVYGENVLGQDYCNLNLCPTGRHIACNQGKFGPQCPANVRAVTLSQVTMDLIIQMHNVRRNGIAGGEFSKFQTARRMPTVSWDNELAKIALMNSKRCIMGHDECRNTPTFIRSGQNVAQTGSGGTPNVLRQHLISIIQAWFGEYKIADMSIINSFRNPKEVGHFTQIVSDRNTRVGCGVVNFKKNGRDILLTTCNYAATNYNNLPVYKTGPAASGCLTGRNSKYPNLCSPSENVNPNSP